MNKNELQDVPYYLEAVTNYVEISSELKGVLLNVCLHAKKELGDAVFNSYPNALKEKIQLKLS